MLQAVNVCGREHHSSNVHPNDEWQIALVSTACGYSLCGDIDRAMTRRVSIHVWYNGISEGDQAG